MSKKTLEDQTDITEVTEQFKEQSIDPNQQTAAFLQQVINIIDTFVSRGAVRGDELVAVGLVRQFAADNLKEIQS